MLYDSTKDYLELKYEGRSHERGWMAEKDHLLQELDHCKEQLNVSKDDVLVISDHVVEQHQTQNMEIEVQFTAKSALKGLGTFCTTKTQCPQMNMYIKLTQFEDNEGRKLPLQ